MHGKVGKAKRSRTTVIGGGVSGSLFAIKLAAADPSAEVTLIEMEERAGPGLAYGACQPIHLLNAPANRMEVGLTPSFCDWLETLDPPDLAPALAEANGDIAQAFLPRALFGTYLKQRLQAATAQNGGPGVRRVRGEAVRIVETRGAEGEGPRRSILLTDGRRIAADRVILATGNLSPKAPRSRDDWFYDTPLFVADLWAPKALDGIATDASVLLIGTGLTMVDAALSLKARGHSGAILALSRRGRLPQAHRAGGQWAPFLDEAAAATPISVLRAARREARAAEAAGVPWQRVMDAVRPAVARIWSAWPLEQRSRFLRHLRPPWDAHRHRMAPRIAACFDEMIASGQLTAIAGRLSGFHDAGERAFVSIAPRGGAKSFRRDFVRVINCTGPRSDFEDVGIPLYVDLREGGRIQPDALGLGIETDDCAVVDRSGRASNWLYALGPLTRSTWWEVTAVPEIAAQVTRLVDELTRADRGEREEGYRADALANEFFDLGAGI
ncbi:MAG: FAD/NAD(P)-binding protein [Methylocella sp.]